MNSNQMTYFNALVQQNDLRAEARRSRQADRAAERPAEAGVARTEAKGHRDHHILDRFNLALPGRR